MDVTMPLTKTDLNKALREQQKNIIVEIGKFLEKHVLEPLFDIKKDVSGIKKDVSNLQMDAGRIERKLDASFDRADRHSKKFEDHEKRIIEIEKVSSLSA